MAVISYRQTKVANITLPKAIKITVKIFKVWAQKSNEETFQGTSQPFCFNVKLMNIKANSVTSSLLMFLKKLMIRQKAILNIFANKMTKPKKSSTNSHFWIDNFLKLFLDMNQCVL